MHGELIVYGYAPVGESGPNLIIELTIDENELSLVKVCVTTNSEPVWRKESAVKTASQTID
jgi:hypothetical protein